MICEIKDTSKITPLFDMWEETLIWSCLQGVMGKIYADDFHYPTAAMAVLGDFTFFAGKPMIEFLSYHPVCCKKDFHIMVPQDEHWKNLIIVFYGENAKIVSRYAIKKEPYCFDKETLEKAVISLPEPYRLSMIDEHLYQKCRQEAWSTDLVAQFPDYQTFYKLGMGAVICKEQQIVSGASSYSRYREGIEIEVDTHKAYRRKGLAYCCCAKLILECLNRNLYPSWDAQNKASVALAEKLGYHYSHTYTAIEVRKN